MLRNDRHYKINNKHQGFTILELMIYFVILSFILGAIVRIEIQTIASYNRNYYQEKVLQSILQTYNFLQEKIGNATDISVGQYTYNNKDYQTLFITQPSQISNFDNVFVDEYYRLRFNLTDQTAEVCRGNETVCAIDGTTESLWVPLVGQNIRAEALNDQIKVCFDDAVGDTCTVDNDCNGGLGRCLTSFVTEATKGPCLPTCGDKVIDAVEQCDDGGICSDNGASCDTGDLSKCGTPSLATCIPQDGDGCSANCSNEVFDNNFNNSGSYNINNANISVIDESDDNVFKIRNSSELDSSWGLWGDLTSVWHLNESTGAIVDSKGTNNGVVSGGVTYGFAGQLNTALDFNGTDGYVQIANDVPVNASGMSVVFWMNFDSAGNWDSMVSKSINGGIDGFVFNIGFGTSGSLVISTSDAGSQYNLRCPIDMSSYASQWVNVAVVWDTTSCKIYLDGVNAISQTTTLGMNTSNVYPTYLGVGFGGNLNYTFNGRLDEVAILNRKLTSDEVKDIYDSQAGNYSIKKPYAQLSAPVTLSASDSLESISHSLTGGGTAEYTIEHNTTDKWWNGSSWVTNSGELQTGDDTWNDLLSVWHLNESSSPIVDPKGGNNGTAYGGVTYQAGGKLNTALSFDGSSGYMTQTTLLDTMPSALSLAFWINPGITYDSSLAENDYVFSKPNISDQDRIKANFTASDGRFNIWTEEGDNGVKSLYTTTNIWAADTWYHIGFTWDTINGKQLYVNGVLENSDATATTLMGNGTDFDFFLGSSNGPVYFFNGVIDEFAIWNTPLTADQIRKLYADQFNNKHTNKTNQLNGAGNGLDNLSTAPNDTIAVLSYLVSDGSQNVNLDDVDLSRIINKNCGTQTCSANGVSGTDNNTCTTSVKELEFNLRFSNSDIDSGNPWYYTSPGDLSFTVPYYKNR